MPSRKQKIDIDPNHWGLKRRGARRGEEGIQDKRRTSLPLTESTIRHMDWRAEMTKMHISRCVRPTHLSHGHTRGCPAHPSNFRRAVLALVELHNILGWYIVPLEQTGYTPRQKACQDYDGVAFYLRTCTRNLAGCIPFMSVVVSLTKRLFWESCGIDSLATVRLSESHSEWYGEGEVEIIWLEKQ